MKINKLITLECMTALSNEGGLNKFNFKQLYLIPEIDKDKLNGIDSVMYMQVQYSAIYFFTKLKGLLYMKGFIKMNN